MEKKKSKEQQKKYRQSDKGKEVREKYLKSDKHKKFLKSDERKQYNKDYLKKYNRSDKGKEVAKKYKLSEKGKKVLKRYKQSEKGKASNKRYSHSDKGKADLKKYQQSEKFKKTRKKYHQSEEGKAVYNKWFRERRKSDPIFKLAYTVRTRLRIFLKTRNIKKTNRTAVMVGCTPEFLKEYLEKKFTSGMTWQNHGTHGWHIDHIVPLDLAMTLEDVQELSHYTNLQPMWATDNIKKSNKII